MRSRLACNPASSSVSGLFTSTVAPRIARRSWVATYSVNAASPLGTLCARTAGQATNQTTREVAQKRITTDRSPRSRKKFHRPQPRLRRDHVKFSAYFAAPPRIHLGYTSDTWARRAAGGRSLARYGTYAHFRWASVDPQCRRR